MSDIRRYGSDRRSSDAETSPDQRSSDDGRSMNTRYYLIIKILKKIPIFNGLSEVQYKQILKICSQQAFEQGERLFWEGDNSDSMFILIKGELKVTFLNGTELTRINPVGLVGEMGIFTGETRSATVEAEVDSILLVFHKKELYRLFKLDCVLASHILMNVIKDLSHKLKKNNIIIEELREVGDPGDVSMLMPDKLM